LLVSEERPTTVKGAVSSGLMIRQWPPEVVEPSELDKDGKKSFKHRLFLKRMENSLGVLPDIIDILY
jgi:hypothetical protein